MRAPWIGIAGRHVDDWYRGFFFPYPPRNLPLARLGAQVHVGDQRLIIFASRAKSHQFFLQLKIVKITLYTLSMLVCAALELVYAKCHGGSKSQN